MPTADPRGQKVNHLRNPCAPFYGLSEFTRRIYGADAIESGKLVPIVIVIVATVMIVIVVVVMVANDAPAELRQSPGNCNE